MSTPPWSGRRLTQALTRTRAQWRGRPCGICGQPINYDAGPDDPHRFSIDHIIARSIRPDLTWDESNWQPAHMSCNKRRHVNTLQTQGTTSRDW